MKRILTTFITILLVVTSCEVSPDWKEHQEDRKEVPGRGDFKTFSFRGHDYIWFTRRDFRSNDSQTSGVVHDPDCRKCKEPPSDSTLTESEENLSEYEKIFGRN